MKEASGDIAREAGNAGVKIRVRRFSSCRFMQNALGTAKNGTNSTD